MNKLIDWINRVTPKQILLVWLIIMFFLCVASSAIVNDIKEMGGMR